MFKSNKSEVSFTSTTSSSYGLFATSSSSFNFSTFVSSAVTIVLLSFVLMIIDPSSGMMISASIAFRVPSAWPRQFEMTAFNASRSYKES